MTKGGALSELNNLLKADDIPFYYKPSIKAIMDTIALDLEQEPKTKYCKDCKWWKDSDGVYRRGIGAESKCLMNTKVVRDGLGYCYKFKPMVESGDKND